MTTSPRSMHLSISQYQPNTKTNHIKILHIKTTTTNDTLQDTPHLLFLPSNTSLILWRTPISSTLLTTLILLPMKMIQLPILIAPQTPYHITRLSPLLGVPPTSYVMHAEVEDTMPANASNAETIFSLETYKGVLLPIMLNLVTHHPPIHRQHQKKHIMPYPHRTIDHQVNQNQQRHKIPLPHLPPQLVSLVTLFLPRH